MNASGGGVNPSVLNCSIMDHNTILSDCFDISSAQQNLELWKIYRQFSQTNPGQAINFLHLPKSTFDVIQEASDSCLGNISSNFLCSFKPHDVNVIYRILDNFTDNSSQQFDSRSLFHYVFWTYVWQISSSTPLRSMLMFELPLDLVKRIGLLSPFQLISFINSVSNTNFELRFNPLIVNLLAGGKNTAICKLIQIMQSLGRDDVIQYTLSKESHLNRLAIINLLSNAWTAQKISDMFELPYEKVLIMIRDANSLKNKPAFNSDDISLQLDLVRREKAKLLIMFGLPNPIVCDLTLLTNANVRTIRRHLEIRKLIPNLPNSSFYQPYKGRKTVLRSSFACAALFLSIYHLIGGEGIYRSINSTAMIYATRLAQQILQCGFFDSLELSFFHPADAYYWARALREAKGKFEFCPKCGCLYPILIDEDNPLEATTPCPFCHLIDTKSSVNRKSVKEIFQLLQPKKIPI